MARAARAAEHTHNTKSLVSAAWIMAWVIYLIMYGLEAGFKASDVLVIPVLLLGPPVALLIFGIGVGWAFRGFIVDERP